MLSIHLFVLLEQITNLSPDGAIRDFVDYDSNTLAVAWDVAPLSRVTPVWLDIHSFEEN